jgi:hypothetical protein
MATPAPSITERPANVFEPRTISFPQDVQDEIAKWIEKQIDSLSKKWERVHN